MTTTTSNYKIEPTNNDILCGKNVKIYAKHPGNIIFQMYLTQLLDEYQSSNRKKEKMIMTAHVVQTMQQRHNARFLTKPKPTAQWKILSHQQARDKTSHAFRHKIQRAEKKSDVFRHTIQRAEKDTSSSKTTSAVKKRGKMKMTARVVQTMKQQHNARFLTKPNTTSPWESVSDKQARNKTSHAIRHKIKRAEKKTSSSKKSTTIRHTVRTTTSSSTFRIVTPESVRPLYSAIAPAVSDCSSVTSHVSEFSDPLQAFSPTNCSQPGSRIDYLDQIRDPLPLYFKTADINSKVNFADKQDDVYDDKSIYEPIPFSNYSAFDEECVEIMVAYLKTQQVSISTFFV